MFEWGFNMCSWSYKHFGGFYVFLDDADDDDNNDDDESGSGGDAIIVPIF